MLITLMTSRVRALVRGQFGIVPLEAMAAGRPVVAVALGGPCESIVHGESGWLCEQTPHHPKATPRHPHNTLMAPSSP